MHFQSNFDPPSPFPPEYGQNKKKNFLGKTSAIGLSIYGKTNALSPFPFLGKTKLLQALGYPNMPKLRPFLLFPLNGKYNYSEFFEHFWAKIRVWSKVRWSEPKSNINYAAAINCGLSNSQKVAFVASGAQQGFRKN